MHVDLDTLATALYVKIDDELKASPELNRYRPTVGIDPKITDAALITVAVLQALLGHHHETRWLHRGRIRLLRLPIPQVLRLAATPGHHRARTARRVRPDQPQGRRA